MKTRVVDNNKGCYAYKMAFLSLNTVYISHRWWLCFETNRLRKFAVNPSLLREVWCRGEVPSELRCQCQIVPYGVINQVVKEAKLFVGSNQCAPNPGLKITYLRCQHGMVRMTSRDEEFDVVPRYVLYSKFVVELIFCKLGMVFHYLESIIVHR